MFMFGNIMYIMPCVGITTIIYTLITKVINFSSEAHTSILKRGGDPLLLERATFSKVHLEIILVGEKLQAASNM